MVIYWGRGGLIAARRCCTVEYSMPPAADVAGGVIVDGGGFDCAEDTEWSGRVSDSCTPLPFADSTVFSPPWLDRIESLIGIVRTKGLLAREGVLCLHLILKMRYCVVEYIHTKPHSTASVARAATTKFPPPSLQARVYSSLTSSLTTSASNPLSPTSPTPQAQ